MTTRVSSNPGESIQITANELRESGAISRWYKKDIKVPDGAQALLEQYAGFAPEEVLPHIQGLVRVTPSRIFKFFCFFSK